MDCIVHGVTKSQTRLSDVHFSCILAVKPQTALLSFLFGVTASLRTYWLKHSHVFITFSLSFLVVNIH